MPDPFLLSHCFAPLQFTLAGPLSPISIRDQMVRAKLFVDRAIQQALVSSARPLLVVGAGAAGVTAAIRAARHGIPTTLMEISGGPFRRQKTCASRWVDPTQYDWPAEHWAAGVFPWGYPSMPLPWRAQRSSAIASDWNREFQRAKARYRHLTFLTHSSLTSLAFLPATNDLSAVIKGLPAPTTFGAAVLCIGFGTERATLGLYSSFEFWDTEPFEFPQLGLPNRAYPYRILIGGGGDGALQDFLRITTGLPSAAALLNHFPPSVDASIMGSIHTAENQAQHAAIWCEPHHEHAVYKALDDVFRVQVQHLTSGPDASAINNTLASCLTHSRNLEVTLAYPCSHFSRCYALNRLMTLLLIDHARKTGLPLIELPFTGVASVTGVHHACANSPAACHGQEHEVRLQSFPTCDGAASGSLSQPQLFDSVILRLGVRPPPPFTGLPGLMLTRQILPYHAPQ